MTYKSFALILFLFSIPSSQIKTGSKEKVCPVDLTITTQEGGGLFAELHKIVQTIIHFEERGFDRIHIDWTDEFFPYKDDAHENGWNLFFEPIPTNKVSTNAETEKMIVESTSVYHELHDQVCTAPWVAYKKYLPYRQFVYEILNKYIKIKPHITDITNDFYENKMRGKLCIGVHARIARAHAWLVPGKKLPTLDDYFAEIDKLIAQHDGQEIVIFVASDSHHAVKQFKERYGTKAVHIDAHRSEFDNDPCIMYTQGEFMKKHPEVWHQKKHGYFGGFSTIQDCLLLAKCDYLIHTTSNLAFFSCYFNPELESIYLPKAIPFKHCRYRNNKEIQNKLLNPL